MDGSLFEITPESYLLDCEDLPSYVCESQKYCLFGIDNMDSEMGDFTQKIFILGETFVKNFYTSFDAQRPKPLVQMAVSKHFKNQAQIHPASSHEGTYFFLMFMSFILTGLLVKTQFKD